MVNNGYTIHTSLPTRFSTHRGTIIDHIFAKTRNNNLKCHSGILMSQISDHLPSFFCIETKNDSPLRPKYITFQDCSSSAQDAFCNEMNSTDLSEYINNEPYCDPNVNYDRLIGVINNIRDKNMPYKSVRVKKHRHKMSPWITQYVL